jgi:acetyl-CoA carboxylase carboxyl transferase alpha subunit
VADTLEIKVDSEQPPVDAETLRAAVWARVQIGAQRAPAAHARAGPRRWRTDVIELHGDRLFRDDPAIVGGFCRLDGRRVVFVGHQKGAETDENIRRNFGMPHPEGYRKAIRLFRLAERLHLPVVTFVDTPGAFPGPASEERGVAEAIARSIQVMTGLRTPIVTVITGEGGSGGALAIAVGDVVLALENAIYSVISPEGCASILWRAPERAQEAAVAMRLTALEQQALGVIDEVIPEPGDGAHDDHPARPPGASASGSCRCSMRLPVVTARRSSTRATRATAGWASSPRSCQRPPLARSAAPASPTGCARCSRAAAPRWACRTRRRRCHRSPADAEEDDAPPLREDV